MAWQITVYGFGRFEPFSVKRKTTREARQAIARKMNKLPLEHPITAEDMHWIDQEAEFILESAKWARIFCGMATENGWKTLCVHVERV